MRHNQDDKVIIMPSAKNGYTEPLELDLKKLQSAVLILRAINHKLRQRILDLLEENGEMTLADIYGKLRLERSVVSQHLATLCRVLVIDTRLENQQCFYRLNVERMEQIARLIKDLAKD